MTSANPYSPGGLVTDRSMFFGREEELKELRSQLDNGACTAVVGLRRIGKSSLLYQLAHQTDKLPEDVVAVYLNSQDARHETPASLLSSALQSLDERMGRRYRFPPVQQLSGFSQAIRQVARDGFRPVLCLDEVEALMEREAFDDNFFNALRALGNERVLAFVTASGDSLDVLIKQSGRSSKFYNIFTHLDLAGLTEEATQALLTEPFRAANAQPLPNNYRDEVLRLAGHYPFYLQMAAYHLYEVRQKGGVVNLDAFRRAFTREAKGHFQGLWRRLNDEERIGVRMLASGQIRVPDRKQTLDDLRRCGLAEGDAEAPHLFSTVFAEMVKTGEIEQEPPARSLASRKKTDPGEQIASAASFLEYAFVALVSVVCALAAAHFLSPDNRIVAIVVFFGILMMMFPLILALAGKITGREYLAFLPGVQDWLYKTLERVLGLWKR